MNHEIIENVKKRIVDEVPNLMKTDLIEIILFGSCARGDYENDSDILTIVIIMNSILFIKRKSYSIKSSLN